MPKPLLLPTPKSLTYRPGTLAIPATGFILLDPHPATADLFAAQHLSHHLAALHAGHWQIARNVQPVSPALEIRAHFDAAIPHDQGYRVTISKSGIDTYARTAAGTFYAFQTLIQIFRQAMLGVAAVPPAGRTHRKSKIENRKSPRLPCLAIADYPDFPRRGVYHDVSRGKVPTLSTLLQLIDDLAALKINEFQLYIENVFEFRRHPQMHDDTTPLTAEEILILDSACRDRHIEFVPSLTSLGHFDKILRRPAFRHLAEIEPAELKKQGIKTWSDDPWSLCVTDPAARKLLADMYDEFLPNFTSPSFNICCDESWDLGKGRSKTAAERKGGVGQLYVNWIKTCASFAKSHNKHIQLWGDIILNHPDLISQLPKDATLLEWGYEADHDFAAHCKLFAASGRPFYVAPGTSTWITLASRSKNAFANIHNAAAAGLKHGAIGLLNTDWGDFGHQQMLAVSLLPFAYGAAASWNLAATPNPQLETGNRTLDTFLASASLQLFQDPTLAFATLAYDLGLTFERFSWQRKNASLEWYLLREPWLDATFVHRADAASLKRVDAATRQLARQFWNLVPAHPDGELIMLEYVFTCRSILHALRRTRVRQQYLAAHPESGKPAPLPLKSYQAELQALSKDAAELAISFKQLWQSRNKPSRLADILEVFARLQTECKQFVKG